jgi:hypothetical protein
MPGCELPLDRLSEVYFCIFDGFATIQGDFKLKWRFPWHSSTVPVNRLERGDI